MPVICTMLPVDDRVVMVSGANRGIGFAVARCLFAKGYRLSLGSRQAHKLSEEFDDTSRVIACDFDARDRESCALWVARTASHFGRIDGLVNNAGISRHVGIEDDDESAYDELWDVNVKGPLRLIRLTLPYLKRSGNGRIVNVASLSGKRVKNLHAGYAMSKFAVVALTHAVRRVGWEDGVRATVICPSFVATDMTASVTAVSRADMIQAPDLAELVATALALPNNAAVAELLVNCRLEDMF